jgi:hypothetical protein
MKKRENTQQKKKLKTGQERLHLEQKKKHFYGAMK